MARLSKLNRTFNRIELNFTNLTNQINNWLGSAYKKSGILFNSASPYGQILDVVKEFFIHNILYLKNFAKQIDIEQANSVRTIRNIARISGHNPSRAISAKGTIKFKFKQGVNINKSVSGGQIIIYENTLLKNKTNSLYYTLKLGSYKNYYTLLPNSQFFINVVQGKYESQTFTGDGTISQSYQVNVSNNTIIDNFDFEIYLNGIRLQIKDHLYDMLENEYSCYTRTGFNGGLDVYFGNGIHGCIPELGSVIEVKYLITSGLIGNIQNNKINDFIFIDNVYDSNGNTLQVEQLFDIFIETNIQFASNGESIEFTKSVIPYVSRNFVLSTPSQFIYHLMKLNMFSKVNAFNNLDMIKIDIDSDGTLDQINLNEMYLYLIPRITDYFSNGVNYFNLPFDTFYLNQIEKDRIINYLKIQGTISITSVVKIVDPQIKLFVLNVFIRRFEDVSEDNIREQIIDTLSSYFSTYSRYDRIVKANIISELKSIDGIDSVNVEFIGKDNENYHKDGALFSSSQKNVLDVTYATNSNSVNISSEKYRDTLIAKNNQNTDTKTSSKQLIGTLTSNEQNSTTSIGDSSIVSYKNTTQYDSKKMIGIDSVLGDIIIGNNELVVLRGGWSNRNGVFFSEDPRTSNGFSTINIIWKGVTPRT